MRGRTVSASLGLALVTGCGGAPTADEQTAARPGSTPAVMAVERVVTGNPPRRDVVLFRPDGRVVGRLRVTAAGGASWSPDGARVAVSVADAQDTTNIVVLDVAGGRATRLTDVGDAFAPVWSPNGLAIVFTRFRRSDGPPTGSLWRVDATGGTAERVTAPEPGAVDVASSFSPDGARLAVSRFGWTDELAPRTELRVVDVETRRVALALPEARDGSFSPDGGQLAYASVRDRNGDNSYGDVTRFAAELYVRDLAGGTDTRLTRTKDLNEGAPAWSPDGRLIAYQRGRVVDNAEGTVVMTMRPDGSCARLVAFDPGLGVWYRGPRWRPGSVVSERDAGCRPSPTVAPLVPPAGNLSLSAARRFRPFRVLWLGRRFGRLVLTDVSRTTARAKRGRGPVVTVGYGSLQLQQWHACVRVPRDVDLPPDGRFRARGVEVWLYEGGNRMEIVTGRSTVVAFGPRAQLRAAVRALRPLGSARKAQRLPPPAPGALAGRLRCP